MSCSYVCHVYERRSRTQQAIATNVQQLLGISRGEPSAPEVVAGPFRLRLDPGRRHTVAVAVVACIVAFLSLWWVFNDHPQTEALAPAAVQASPSAASSLGADSGVVSPRPSDSSSPHTAGAISGKSAESAGSITVDVAGKVVHPGLYELPAGSRVQTAIAAAGGALPGVDLSTVNLARRLTDGEQVAIAVSGAPTSASSGSAGSGPAGLINLNTATAEQLDTLPGVGPALAKKIIDWRSVHHRFDSVEKLREVSGIGPAKYDELKALVTV